MPNELDQRCAKNYLKGSRLLATVMNKYAKVSVIENLQHNRINGPDRVPDWESGDLLRRLALS
jgi:hypothetical protein